VSREQKFGEKKTSDNSEFYKIKKDGAKERKRDISQKKEGVHCIHGKWIGKLV
jgi:hypothetical protein